MKPAAKGTSVDERIAQAADAVNLNFTVEDDFGNVINRANGKNVTIEVT